MIGCNQQEKHWTSQKTVPLHKYCIYKINYKYYLIITTTIILSATLRQSSSISVYFRASRWLEEPFYRRTKWRNGRVAEGQPCRYGTEIQIHVGLKTGITILLAYLPLKLSSLEICWKKNRIIKFKKRDKTSLSDRQRIEMIIHCSVLY